MFENFEVDHQFSRNLQIMSVLQKCDFAGRLEFISSVPTNSPF